MAKSTLKLSGAIQIGSLASAPSNPQQGMIYVDPNNSEVLLYSGSQFNKITDQEVLDAILGTLNSSPSSYTPSSADHAGHLDGIDTALGLKADSSVVTEIDANVDDLVSLSGVSENSTDLGTFTGSIITDNSDIKTALQELESEIQNVGGSNEFSDDVFRINDNLDNTKKISFQASAISTGTVRSVSMPDSDVDLGLVSTAIQSSEKGANSGVATLDASGKLSNSQVPAIAITSTFVVADEASQLALTVQEGDIAVRSDLNQSYVALNDTNASLSDWQILLTPTDSVLSVNGATGVVVLDSGDITEGSNLYYTQARFDSAFSAKSTSDLSEGTNLYYTDSRVDARIAAASVTDLSDVTDAGSGVIISTAERALVSSALQPADNISELTNDSGFIANVSEDSTPELGGNLDIGTNVIVHGSDGMKLGSSASDFYEQEYIHSISLLASQTDTVISDLSFAHASFDGCEIVYKLKDSAGVLRIGTLRLVTDGTNVSINDVGSELGDSSLIEFDAAVNGLNVEISYSSGVNTATLRCEVKRFLV